MMKKLTGVPGAMKHIIKTSTDDVALEMMINGFTEMNHREKVRKQKDKKGGKASAEARKNRADQWQGIARREAKKFLEKNPNNNQVGAALHVKENYLQNFKVTTKGIENYLSSIKNEKEVT